MIPTSIHSTEHLNWLRLLNRVLPLKHRYTAWIKQILPQQGLFAVSDSGQKVLYPCAWLDTNTTLLLEGLKGTIPDRMLSESIVPTLTEGICVDVGANTGNFTMWLRSLTHLPIVAFEPDPLLGLLFEINIEHNGLKDIQLIKKGCGREACTAPFFPRRNGYIPPATDSIRMIPTPQWNTLEDAIGMHVEDDEALEIHITSLDNAIAENQKVAFLKIDCEGYEAEVLAGAQKILEKDRPHIHLELHPHILKDRGLTPKQILDSLSPHYHFTFAYAPKPRNKVLRFLRRYLSNPMQVMDWQSMERVINSPQCPGSFHALCQPKS